MTSSSISDFLLVPIEVQAVVVNDPVLAETVFFDGKFNYENVPQFLTPAPRPFDDGGTKPDKGVHLHWELPAAFRHGNKPTDTDPLDFPYVPNRWLILRYWPGQSAADRQLKAWVLQSDYHGPDGSSPFLDPTVATPTPTLLGRSTLLADFSEPGNKLFLKSVGPGNVTFSAFRVNAQDVFSFWDDTSDIPLQSNQTVYLSYVVLGWYSDPTYDPLYGLTDAAAWAAKMAALQWLTNPAPYAIAGASPPQKSFGIKGYGDLSSQLAAGSQFTVVGSQSNDGAYTVAASGPIWDATDGHLTVPVETGIPAALADGYIVTAAAPSSWPTQSLAHGLLYNVAWQNDTLPERPNSTHDEIAATVKLAVGNSAIDALAAMIVAVASSDEGESDSAAQADAVALEAFQYNLLAELDKPGGQAQLDKQLRSKWFSADDGGTIWRIVGNPAASAGSKFQPNGEQETWLAQLNYYQQGLDRETRVLESMQYNLYALWWRTKSIEAGSYPRPLAAPPQFWDSIQEDISNQLPTEAATVKAQIENVAAWQAQINALQAAPPSYQSGQTLVSIAVPPDPPLPAPPPPDSISPLLLKANKMPRFFEPVDPVILISGLGASINQTNQAKAGQEALPCRLGSQSISAVAVDGTAIGADALAAHVALPNSQNGGQNLPPGVESASATLALESVFLDPANASLLASISGQPETEIAAALRAGQAYTGLVPDPIAAAQWQQAWVPLLLDWQVTWYPTVSAPVINAGNGPQWRFDRAGWAFDGLDYNWTGQDVSQPSAGAGSQSYPIYSVNPSANSYTLAGVGNLGFQFSSGAEFRISGSSATYTVTSTTCDAQGNFTITAAGGTVTEAQVGQTITPQVLSGGQITLSGRTFLTPTATFNFRAQLQRYLKSHGGRYSIAGVDSRAQSFTVHTDTDLSEFFQPGGTFYVAQSSANNGTYTVASCSYNLSAKTFTVVASQAVPSATADGVLVSEPLAETAHLIDIIGGARYQVIGANSSEQSFTLRTAVDLNHLFAADSSFAIAESPYNNGTYTVAATAYDQTNRSFTIVVHEAVLSSNPGGVAVPEPQAWDLLSQSLSGFTQQLLMRDLEPNQKASGSVASGPAQGTTFSDLVGAQDHTLPWLTLGDASQPALGAPTPYYFPVRGGFFALSNLALIDRFGQKIDLLFANHNNQAASPTEAWQTFAPLRSRWVTPEADTNMTNPTRLIKLPPRSGLAGRLDFRFVSAPDPNDGALPPDTDIELVAAANPVAGWVLPNHLDNGLLVYAADGAALGELVLSQTGGDPPTTVEWFPTPMSTKPITDPTNPSIGIPNPQLRGFVAGILGLAAKQRGDAFANFLQAVDETLWAVDPLGGRSDQNLSVLVGRPLALVRARLKLVTCGEPTCDQSTQYQIPLVQPVSAVDTGARSFSFVISANLAETGRYEPGSTVTIVGSAANDGVYHIVNTGYDGSNFTVYVAEEIPSSIVGGNLTVPPPQGGLTNTPFTLRLGRADLFDDGLIGYYVGDDYTKCYNVHALEDFTPGGYLYPIGQNGENYLSITYYAESTQGGPPSAPTLAADPHSIFVTMLVDPRGTVNASTGILPTEELTLPARFYEAALAKLEIYFQTGPLLVDAEAIRLPRPTEQNGSWSWIQKNEPGADLAVWEADPITKSDDKARFPALPLQLRDGWLKLTSTDLEA